MTPSPNLDAPAFKSIAEMPSTTRTALVVWFQSSHPTMPNLQHSAEEKIRIVLAGLRGEDSIAEHCRREGIAESLYYSWSKEFLEAGKRRLAGTPPGPQGGGHHLRQAGRVHRRAFSPRDLGETEAAVLFTSGTEETPKGVVLTAYFAPVAFGYLATTTITEQADAPSCR